MSTITTAKTSKPVDIFFKSPVGLARYPRTQHADTRFNEKGVYSVGLLITPEELAEVQSTFEEIFRNAFPAEKAPIRLPIKTDDTGARYLVAKSSFKPKTLDADRQPVDTVEHGARIRFIGRARPFRTPLIAGVALYLSAVDVLDAKPEPMPAAASGFMGDPLPF